MSTPIIVHVDDRRELRSGGKVQDVIIADCTGHIILSVWENQQGKIKESGAYVMKGLMVKDFHGYKCLTTSKQICTIEEIDDIVKGSEDTLTKFQVSLVKNVRTFAVDKLEKYNSCVQCSGKVISAIDDDDIGECPKCGSLHILSECKLTLVAQLRMKGESEERFSLTAFDEVVEKITEVPADSITKRDLIKADAFNMKFSDGVVYYVERP